MTGRLQISVLSGRLELIGHDGSEACPITIASPLQRALLSALLTHTGRAVPREMLIDLMWGDHPPRGCNAVLSTHATRLRAALDPYHPAGTTFIPRSSGGYRFDHDHAEIDLVEWTAGCAALVLGGSASPGLLARFDRLAHTDDVEAGIAEMIDTAWVGARTVLPVLLDQTSDAAGWTRLERVLGAAQTRSPYDEQLAAWWLTAVTRTRGPSLALQRYAEIAARLRDDLGVDPGPELRATQERVLAETVSDRGGADETTLLTRQLPGEPTSLPPVPLGYAGRASDLELIMDLARTAPERGPRVIMVTGAAGLGKSTTALVVAHELAGEFPDGRVMVEASADGRVDAASAATGALRALGVRSQVIPDHPDRVLEFYRAYTAGKAILYVLDNLAPTSRVQALLPAGSRSLVLATARTPHEELLGAPTVDLAPLDAADALALLRATSPGRAITDDQATRDLLDLCGGHPLALRICARLLATHPSWSVDRLVTSMRGSDRMAQVLLPINSTLRTLLVEAARLLPPGAMDVLDAIGLLDAPRIEAWMIAVTLGITDEEAQHGLDDLEEARLVDAVGTDWLDQRYALTSVVRAFAADQAHRVPAGETAARVERFLATAATEVLRIAELGDGVLVATVALAARHGRARQAAELAEQFAEEVFTKINSTAAWRETHELARQACRTAGDTDGAARATLGLARRSLAVDDWTAAAESAREVESGPGGASQDRGRARLIRARVLAEQHRRPELLDLIGIAEREPGLTAADRGSWLRLHAQCLRDHGDLAEAGTVGEAAIATHRELDDVVGLAVAIRSHGLTARASGDHAEAVRRSEESLRLVQPTGAVHPTAYARQALVKARLRLGIEVTGPDLEELLREALQAFVHRPDLFGQALVHRTLGELFLVQGQPHRAEPPLRLAVAAWQRLGLPGWVARARATLATCLDTVGRTDQAQLCRDEALVVFRRLQMREAAEVVASTA